MGATKLAPTREYTITAALGGKMVVFGGSNSGTSLNDTWTFDGASWKKLSVASSPPARWDASMATLGDKIVLFGGIGGGGTLNDTWTFDGTSWIEVSASNPPPARETPSMATLGDKIVLFGGCGHTTSSGCTLMNDTWTFDGTSWIEVSVSSPPPSRGSASMAFIP
jgi:N-acetylneuraminic acid mutarotase